MNEENEEIFRQLKRALKTLKEDLNPEMIPASGMTIAFAKNNAVINGEVAGVPDRITASKGKVIIPDDIMFSADTEISSAILTAMKYDGAIRSAATIKYSEKNTEIIREYFPEVRSFDPERLPPVAASVDWGIAACCKEGDVPDVIFNRESTLREGRILVLGEDPVEIVRNIINLQRRINNKNQ